MGIQIISIAIQIVQIVIFCYIGFGTLYIFIFSIAGLFKYRSKETEKETPPRIAVLIPGYKEDLVIIEAASDTIKQNYPLDRFDIIIIADSFQDATIQALKSIPVQVIEVSFENSTKSKALNKAMAQLPDNFYDIVIILDADNLMEKDFLYKIARAFTPRFIGIQGHRVAKNTNTAFAILDAISEEINNHIFRKGHRVLGFSSSLIGSGMAFNYTFFKKLMSNVLAIGGFDKEIELKMLGDGLKLEYLKDAYIFDEKVQAPEVFIKQRRRWLSAQMHYSKYLLKSIRQLITKGNLDFFDKSIQMLLPPPNPPNRDFTADCSSFCICKLPDVYLDVDWYVGGLLPCHRMCYSVEIL